jgi:DNA-binding response OmpR family regulator
MDPRVIAPVPTPMLLVVEPDPTIAAALLGSARRRAVRAEWCRDGGEALVLAGATQPDVLIVAARLPTLSPREVIQILRNRWRMSILVGASDGDELLAGEALEAGATAAVARPYDLDAILTLGLGLTTWAPPAAERDLSAQQGGALAAGPIAVDLERHEARIDGRELPLTHRELQLLLYLIHRGGRVASRAEITAAVWGSPMDTNTVAVHIKRLRDKIGEHPRHGQVIRTVRGAGYRLAPSLYEEQASNTTAS